MLKDPLPPLAITQLPRRKEERKIHRQPDAQRRESVNVPKRQVSSKAHCASRRGFVPYRRPILMKAHPAFRFCAVGASQRSTLTLITLLIPSSAGSSFPAKILSAAVAIGRGSILSNDPHIQREKFCQKALINSVWTMNQ